MKLREPVGHLDQVGLTRDSREVAEEDEQHRAGENVGQMNGGAVGPQEREVRDCVADGHSQSPDAIANP